MPMEMNSKPEKQKKLSDDILPLVLSEAAIILLVILGGALLGISGVINLRSTIIPIVVGALLGGAVIIANHLFLTISVDRAINQFMNLRGEGEMSDEDAEKFAKENSAPIQNAIKVSFIIRTASMLAVLVVAFLTGFFNPIATAIPMLLYRPALSVIEYIRGKK